MQDLRDRLVKELRWSFFGPDHSDTEEELEILNRIEREDPGKTYITGILAPQLMSMDDESSTDDSPFSKTGANDSSFGFTFCLPSRFKGSITYGADFSTYDREVVENVETFIRNPHSLSFSFDELTIQKESKIEKKLLDLGKTKDAVKLILTRRSDIDNPLGLLFTLSIVHFGKEESALRPWRSSLFHVRLWIKSTKETFKELPFDSLDLSEDKKQSSLLYRNVHRYAVGHGCGVHWQDQEVKEIESTFFPQVEVPVFQHNDLDTEALSMLKWAKGENDHNSLKTISASYASWLEEQNEMAKSLTPKLFETFQENREKVLYIMERIEKGIELLKSDKKVGIAFKLMNQAMLTQQLRSKLSTVHIENGQHGAQAGKAVSFQIYDPTTWPFEDTTKYGRWRLFQMAFILMCIPDLVEGEKEPSMDLIWFPTGGGKTEAYLGLSAFLLLLERLEGKKTKGVKVIMRYTLRLLTAQQFERASALVLALDDLRLDNIDSLGKTPFKIGLWVGGDVTFNKHGSNPHNWTQEVTTSNQWYENLNFKYKINRKWPWVLQKCPRCAREFGLKREDGKYKAFGVSRNHEEKIVYSCECSPYPDKRLPIVVIDEDIYSELPSIVIATVDKFARLPWDAESSKILGVNAIARGIHSKISLIIQDELHLLEGPLGTIVGIYESAIDYLIARTGARPKRIGSSATLAMAQEQCNSLYGLEPKNVRAFPPPLMNWDDNYFSFVQRSSKGRRYVGIYANGSPSNKTTQYKLFASLLQAGGRLALLNEKEGESFSTLLNYFNSKRDMGHALSLMGDDVPREIYNLQRRFAIPKEERRRFIDINSGLVQLHGTVDSDTVQKDMSRLMNSNGTKDHVHTVLATNMISVGLDVPRLSMMTILHQPKTMSEYIQASSRIGRGKTPGIVFVLLSALRSRDRSHLEDFKLTHEKMYSLVEPSSLTPFSTSAIERALPGVLTAIFRNDPEFGLFETFGSLDPRMTEIAKDFFVGRISAIDPKELDHFIEKFDAFCHSWNRGGYRAFGKEFHLNRANVPLMVPFLTPWTNGRPNPYQVLQAMRNVDSGIQLTQIEQ